MTDQAQRLREIVADLEHEGRAAVGAGFFARAAARLPRIITITSGDGDSATFPSLVANLAVGLAKLSPPVLILDAGFQARTLNRLVGRRPPKSLNDLTRKNTDLSELVAEGPAGVNLMLVDQAFIERLATLDVGQLEPLVFPLSLLKNSVHLVLLSLDNGFSLAALNFLVASPEVVLVTSADETAVRQFYLLLKIIHKKNPQCRLGLVTAQGPGERRGRPTGRNIAATAQKLLGCPVTDLGTMVQEEPAAAGFSIVEHPRSALGKSVDIIAGKLYYNPQDN
jgi:flagellar biosynthesis protein FlhG